MQRGTRIAKPFMKDRMRLDTASWIRMLQETARTLAAHLTGCYTTAIVRSVSRFWMAPTPRETPASLIHEASGAVAQAGIGMT